MPRVIKKYANRKLYDVESSRYVTLEELGKMVEQGLDVRIIDNETGEDISGKTLAQVLVNLEKKQKSSLPFPLFKELIQKSGDSVLEYTKRSIMAGLGVLSTAEGEIEKVVRRFAEKGLVSEEEARGIIRDFLISIEKSKNTLDHKIEENIRKVLHTLNIPSQSEVKDLKQKIVELEEKLAEMTKAKRKRSSR
ncbi:phasin family protein [bacterium]|nr:phasin family protein [bacterium]